MSKRIDPNRMPDQDLVDALFLCAGGLGSQAAVNLLVEHGHFLSRIDFRRDCLDVTEDEGEQFASVDWNRAAEVSFPCSNSERSILLIAASLATSDIKVNLRDVITGLDTFNTRRVLAAIAHAAGKDGLVDHP